MNQLKTDKSRYWIAANLRGREVFSETAFERYSYNARSEVIGSQRFYGSDISDLSRPVTGRTFGYGYDPIGNRVFSFEDVGGERLTTTYAANELNQYIAIQNPGAVPLRGDAKREAVVTMNGDRAERDNGTASFTPWSYSLPSDDTTAHYQNANVLAVAQNAVGEDVEQRESGSLFVPAAETFLTYDDDGNMTFDGRFRYSWNGENRMIRAEEDVAPTNRAPTIITYAYDEQGRMVSKNIVGTNTIARLLLWDGYNIVREADNDVATYNIWGLDLDGTLQGCGGVGGLLAVAKTNGLHVALYDANGNVSEYISQDGYMSAHYEYSTFGSIIDGKNNVFSFLFSTTPFCPITNLSEYQTRLYIQMIGRWISRDIANEQAGENLFAFVRNSPVGTIDLRGMLDLSWKTRYFVLGDLGEFAWGISWHLSEKAPQNGYVIQEISYLRAIWDCNDSLVDLTIDTDHFWEALGRVSQGQHVTMNYATYLLAQIFRLDNNQPMTLYLGDDTWREPKHDACTKGIVLIAADAVYHSGNKYPPEGFRVDLSSRATWAPMTRIAPNLSQGIHAAPRILGIRWNGCNGDNKTKVIFKSQEEDIGVNQ